MSCLRRTAGTWLFSHRRWLNPCDHSDAVQLDLGYSLLCMAYPAFTGITKRELFDVVKKAEAQWQRLTICHSRKSKHTSKVRVAMLEHSDTATLYGEGFDEVAAPYSSLLQPFPHLSQALLSFQSSVNGWYTLGNEGGRLFENTNTWPQQGGSGWEAPSRPPNAGESVDGILGHLHSSWPR